MTITVIRADEAQFLKMCVYGTAGSGKTRLLETAHQDPRMFPALLLDLEAGTQSVVGSEIPIIRVKTLADFNEIYQGLLKKTLVYTAADGSKLEYKTLCLDSLTEVHQRTLIEIVADDMKSGRRKTIDLVEQGDYGRGLIQMRRLVRGLRDLPMHFLTTALVKDDFDQREGTVRKPALSGAFAEEIGGLVDALCYLGMQKDDKGKDQRALVLQPKQGLRAKFRLPLGVICPDVIIDPNMTKVMNIKEISHAPIA